MSDLEEKNPSADFRFIGKPVVRKEDERLTTGRGRFSDDFSVDGQAFAGKMKNLCLQVARHPKVLLDTCWDDRGEMSRPSFMVQVRNGAPVVIGTVPAN